MDIHARLTNTLSTHAVITTTGETDHTLPLKPKADGLGAEVNGAELLCAALATCFCNVLYREAPSHDITVIEVNVHVRSEFGGAGGPARQIGYSVEVTASGEEPAIHELIRHVDSVAEIHNTLRLGMPVLLERVDVRSIGTIDGA